MPSLNETETLPLKADADGVIRVSETRVTLDTIVGAFREGATPEEIADQYSAVPLADIYIVIGYFLRHLADVDDYLSQRRQFAEAVRAENEARLDPSSVRQRLLARRRPRVS